MRYLSYGHEFILSIILVMTVCHILLDLAPLWYRRVSRAFAKAPLYTGSRFILIAFVWVLL